MTKAEIRIQTWKEAQARRRIRTTLNTKLRRYQILIKDGMMTRIKHRLEQTLADQARIDLMTAETSGMISELDHRTFPAKRIKDV